MASTDRIEKLARKIDYAEHCYNSGFQRLQSVKQRIAEFVILNINNIENIDLSAFHDEANDAQLLMDLAREDFDAAKNQLLTYIQCITLAE